MTSEADRRALFESEEFDGLIHWVWLEVQNHEPIDVPSLMARFSRYERQAELALRVLVADGRVIQTGDLLRAQNFVVPLGSERGWEAAVLDHFQTMARAIAAKLTLGKAVASATDDVGGSTLSFTIYPGHPREAEVARLLSSVRALVLPLWQEVSDYNGSHPPPSEARRVAFYCGQSVETVDAGTDEAPE